MSNDTTVGVISGLISGAYIASVIAAYIHEYVNDRHEKKSTPILDKQYGPKIKSNLTALEDAVKIGNKERAFALLQERSKLIDETYTINQCYLHRGRVTKGIYASSEVQTDIAKGASLEAYLKA